MNHPGMSQPADSPHAILDKAQRPTELTKYDEVLLKMEAQSIWVYVVVERRKEMTSGGLYMPKSAKDMFARVLHVGPEVTKTKVKPGDLVIFKDGVQAIPLNYVNYVKDDYTFVHELNIIGKVADGAEIPRIYETGKK